MSGPKRLIAEVHRHSLWQIVGIYLGGAWLAYEIIQGITEGRGLLEWLPALALVLLVICGGDRVRARGSRASAC